MPWWNALIGRVSGAGQRPSDGVPVLPAATGPEDTVAQARLVLVRRLLSAAQTTTNASLSDSSANIIDRMLSEIRAAFGAEHACIHFVREAGLAGGTTMSGMVTCPVGSCSPDLAPHLAGLERKVMLQALEMGKPVLLAESAADVVHQLGGHVGFTDGIVVPIAYQGEAFAWINVFVAVPRPFDDVEQGLLRAVGGVLYGSIKKDAYVSAIQRIRQTLETHFSPRVVDKLLSNPESLSEHRSERLEVTVLFSDIRGFTALSERLDPEDVAEMVSEHLETMAEVVFRYGGIVDKYIGDSVMAVFGSPFPSDDHPRRAVAAGLAMVEAQRGLQARWGERVNSPLAIGIGINTGVAIVGDVGVSRREFTHLGDTVNLASRLKDVAAPWQVLVNQSTFERVQDVVAGDPVEPFSVKGKQEPVHAVSITRYTGDQATLLG